MACKGSRSFARPLRMFVTEDRCASRQYQHWPPPAVGAAFQDRFGLWSCEQQRDSRRRAPDRSPFRPKLAAFVIAAATGCEQWSGMCGFGHLTCRCHVQRHLSCGASGPSRNNILPPASGLLRRHALVGHTGRNSARLCKHSGLPHVGPFATCQIVQPSAIVTLIS